MMFISMPKGARLRLATKPSPLPASALTLPILRPSAIAVASMSGALLVPFTTSNSFMTLAGAKKCVPATSCGRFVAFAMMSMSMPEVFENSSAPGFITCVELFEDLLLDRDLLEHGLDHHVASAMSSMLGTGWMRARRRSISSSREAAALDAGLVIGADARHAAVERLLGRVDDLHGEAEIGKAHRDAAAHRAGADDGRFSVGRSGVSRGMSGNLATSRSAKKA